MPSQPTTCCCRMPQPLPAQTGLICHCCVPADPARHLPASWRFAPYDQNTDCKTRILSPYRCCTHLPRQPAALRPLQHPTTAPIAAHPSPAACTRRCSTHLPRQLAALQLQGQRLGLVLLGALLRLCGGAGDSRPWQVRGTLAGTLAGMGNRRCQHCMPAPQHPQNPPAASKSSSHRRPQPQPPAAWRSACRAAARAAASWPSNASTSASDWREAQAPMGARWGLGGAGGSACGCACGQRMTVSH